MLTYEELKKMTPEQVRALGERGQKRSKEEMANLILLMLQALRDPEVNKNENTRRNFNEENTDIFEETALGILTKMEEV